MGVVIPFPAPNSTTVAPPPITASAEERRRLAETHTRTVCSRLLDYYQNLGEWNPACESHMVTAVRALMTICYHLTPVPIISRGDDEQKV